MSPSSPLTPGRRPHPFSRCVLPSAISLKGLSLFGCPSLVRVRWASHLPGAVFREAPVSENSIRRVRPRRLSFFFDSFFVSWLVLESSRASAWNARPRKSRGPQLALSSSLTPPGVTGCARFRGTPR